MSKNICVSICCITYNHVDYIERALDGFLMQKTDFDFEILIHDDCSTDGTIEILKRYKEQYPDMIQVIYEKENQYSKGTLLFQDILYPKSRGEYIAICEGDDYWIDPLKLQKQIDYLMLHPDCTFCFTNGIIENQCTKERRKFVPYSKQDEKYYRSGNKEIRLDHSYEMSFIPTASFVFPRKCISQLPQGYHRPCPTGDLQARLFLTSLGYAYFIDEQTSVYREAACGSMMERWKKDDQDCIKAYERQAAIVSMINEVDAFTNGMYTEGLNRIKDVQLYPMLYNLPNLDMLKIPDLNRVYKTLSFPERSKVRIKIKCFNERKFMKAKVERK